jgi:hypothetical protein
MLETAHKLPGSVVLGLTLPVCPYRVINAHIEPHPVARVKPDPPRPATRLISMMILRAPAPKNRPPGFPHALLRAATTRCPSRARASESETLVELFPEGFVAPRAGARVNPGQEQDQYGGSCFFGCAPHGISMHVVILIDWPVLPIIRWIAGNFRQ